MEWIDIKDYEGLYKINEDGQILSLKSKYKTSDRIIKNYISKNGYIVTYLTKNNKTKTIKVHILLAKTFIPNPNNYPCVLHLDDIKLNITLSNLIWGTHSQNIRMAFANGVSNQSGFKNNAGKIKNIETLLQIKDDWASNPRKIIQYKDNSIWADNEIAQKLKALLDTPQCRMYSGRRIFRAINRGRIRATMQKAKFY